MSDVRTLRLATLQLTDELLVRFMSYQRQLLAALAQSVQGDWAGRFAFAHGHALTQSGLDALSQQQLKAASADYCGRRSASIVVRGRVAEAELRVSSNQPKPGDAAMLERARTELPGLEDLSELEARYGAEALGLLRAHEDELLALHRELVRLEGASGDLHLHRAPRPI